MDHEEQLQDELALIDLEERQILIERRKLQVKRQLAEIKRRKQTEPDIVDLAKEQDEVVLKRDPQGHIGQPTVQKDTVPTSLLRNNTASLAAANTLERGKDRESAVPKVEKEDASLTQPRSGENVKASDPHGPSQAQNDPGAEAATGGSGPINPPSQQPAVAPTTPKGVSKTVKLALPFGSTSRADTLKRPISATDDHSTGRPGIGGKTGDTAPLEQDTPKKKKPRKSRALEGDIPKAISNQPPVRRRQDLAVYYRKLLADHFDSLPVPGSGRTTNIYSGLRGTVRCDPQNIHRQIHDFMRGKRKPEKFDDTMGSCVSNWKLWWPVCLALPNLERQKAMVRRVVAQLIDGTFNREEFGA